MIQRKQTIFLLLAVILTVLCLCMPIGSIEPKGMGLSTVIWNLGSVIPNQGMNFSNWPLFALLVVTIPMELAAIFLYRNRLLQAKLCAWSMVFCLAWYVYYAFIILNLIQSVQAIYHIAFAAYLPIIILISLLLARRGIMHDEKLVRSADRIR